MGGDGITQFGRALSAVNIDIIYLCQQSAGKGSRDDGRREVGGARLCLSLLGGMRCGFGDEKGRRSVPLPADFLAGLADRRPCADRLCRQSRRVRWPCPIGASRERTQGFTVPLLAAAAILLVRRPPWRLSATRRGAKHGGSRPRLNGIPETSPGTLPCSSRTRQTAGMQTTGLIDLQVNGYAGVDFNDPGLDAAALEHALGAMLRAGVTTCLPTLIRRRNQPWPSASPRWTAPPPAAGWRRSWCLVSIWKAPS